MLDVEAAVDCALAGEPAGGYEALLVGLRLAEVRGKVGLAARYREALDRYAARWRNGRA